MRIAIDFDDTIMDYDTGEEIEGAGEQIRKWKAKGYWIIIFTCNWVTHMGLLRGWLKAHNIPYDDIQMNKPIYNLFIDDRARQFKGWKEDYENTL